MAANSSIQLSGLDFDSIKNNLKGFLQSQNTFKDYNFEGSGLSVLLDVLAYNTQYNAFYLNMVANEMFLDTALQRSSVVSHAKLLNYTPKSATAPTAFVNMTVTNVFGSSFTVPSYTSFLSEPIDGINYNFVTTQSTTVNTSNNTASFTNLEIRQGIPVSYSYTVSETANPTYTFELPDSGIDTNTIRVIVQESASNTAYNVFEKATNYLALDSTSEVYFLQEALNGNYQINFGDGILGKKLKDNNVVIIDYIITQGTASAGANNFVLMDDLTGTASNTVVTVTGYVAASQGGEKETLASIKYQAPKSYAAQGRAVTKEDYITAIQQNNIGLAFDAVNVWGGEENTTPVYGKVFVCLKPSGSYNLTNSQKQKLISDVIKPISIMTVDPVIVDPDYTYLKVNANVLYDPKKTTQTSADIQNIVKAVVSSFSTSTLNTFDSTFVASDLTAQIKSSNPSIIAAEVSIQVQKKFYPNLINPTNYTVDFGVPLERGILLSGITSTPSMIFRDLITPTSIVNGIYLEEEPTSTGGVETFHILNPGFGYQYPPTITIMGDGTGATAECTLDTNGAIRTITVTNAGSGYTSAIATITPVSTDTTGQLGAAAVILQGRFGNLRSYYSNNQNVKTIYNSSAGTVDYQSGIITLDSFNPININNDLGQLTISANPTTTIISSSYNKIITIDPFDPTAIVVNITAKA